MEKHKIGLFIAFDLIAVLLIRYFMQRAPVYEFLFKVLPDADFTNIMNFRSAAESFLAGLLALLLTALFFLNLEEPEPIQERKQKRLRRRTAVCGFLACYRAFWDVACLVASSLMGINLLKNPLIYIIAYPFDLLGNMAGYMVFDQMNPFLMFYFFFNLVPLYIHSAMIFIALYGVRLLRKAPAETAI